MSLSDFLYKSLLFFVRRNREFFLLLSDFELNLPPKQKKAKSSIDDKGMSVVETTNMKLNLTDKEIDLFQKKLENFPYHRIWFGRKKIVRYSANIQRILQSNNWTKFNIAMLQNIFEEHDSKKPYLLGFWVGRRLGY